MTEAGPLGYARTLGPLGIPARTVNQGRTVDGLVTDRFYGRSDGTNLRTFFDSRIVADSQ